MHRVSAEILFHIRTASFRTHRLSQWGTYYILKMQNNQHNLPKAKRESAIMNIFYLFTKYTPLNITACLVTGAAS